MEMLPELKQPLGELCEPSRFSVEVPNLLLKHKFLVLSFVFVKGRVQAPQMPGPGWFLGRQVSHIPFPSPRNFIFYFLPETSQV